MLTSEEISHCLLGSCWQDCAEKKKRVYHEVAKGHQTALRWDCVCARFSVNTGKDVFKTASVEPVSQKELTILLRV